MTDVASPSGPAPPRVRLLARIVRLTPIAAGAAAGMIVVGVLGIVGGAIDHRVIRDQLAPQKIVFPASRAQGLFPDLQQYAGQQVLSAGQAKAYADRYIARHLEEIGHGQTYSQVSARYLKDPKNAQLAQLRATLFQGETLRGLLLNAWGWGTFGSIVLAAGIVLLVVGSLLFLLPVLNWLLNERRA